MEDAIPQGIPAGGLQTGHEDTTIPVRGLVIAAISLVVTVVVCQLVLAWWLRGFKAEENKAEMLHPGRQEIDVAQFPQPRLQESPPVELVQMVREEKARITSYGWVDPKAGIARIPVDRAMEILAEKGLPKVAAPPPTAGCAAQHDHPPGPEARAGRAGGEPARDSEESGPAAARIEARREAMRQPFQPLAPGFVGPLTPSLSPVGRGRPVGSDAPLSTLRAGAHHPLLPGGEKVPEGRMRGWRRSLVDPRHLLGAIAVFVLSVIGPVRAVAGHAGRGGQPGRLRPEAGRAAAAGPSVPRRLGPRGGAGRALRPAAGPAGAGLLPMPAPVQPDPQRADPDPEAAVARRRQGVRRGGGEHRPGGDARAGVEEEGGLPGALRPARDRIGLALPHGRSGVDRRRDRGDRLPLHVQPRDQALCPRRRHRGRDARRPDLPLLLRDRLPGPGPPGRDRAGARRPDRLGDPRAALALLRLRRGHRQVHAVDPAAVADPGRGDRPDAGELPVRDVPARLGPAPRRGRPGDGQSLGGPTIRDGPGGPS